MVNDDAWLAMVGNRIESLREEIADLEKIRSRLVPNGRKKKEMLPETEIKLKSDYVEAKRTQGRYMGLRKTLPPDAREQASIIANEKGNRAAIAWIEDWKKTNQKEEP